MRCKDNPHRKCQSVRQTAFDPIRVNGRHHGTDGQTDERRATLNADSRENRIKFMTVAVIKLLYLSSNYFWQLCGGGERL